MANIAISYRREDTAAVSGRICDRLRARYGHGCVFMDVDSIRTGSDFRERIRETVGKSSALVVVIGKRWLRQRKTGPAGEQADWVSLELTTAFEGKIPIVPILVDGAAMPKPEDLPENIRPLAYLRAAEVSSGEDFHPQIDRVILDLDAQIAANLARSHSVSATLSGTALRWRAAIVSVSARCWARLWRRAMRFGRFIASKSPWHWLSALAILALSEWAEPYVQSNPDVRLIQYRLYRIICDFNPRLIEPRFTRVVMIGDEGHQRYRPPGRDYIANIVDKLHAADAAVIALDFDLQLPDSNDGTSGNFKGFEPTQLEQTTRLVAAIVNAANDRTKIVLPRSIKRGTVTALQLEAGVYQTFGLCQFNGKHWYNKLPRNIPPVPKVTPIELRRSENISCGYIALPDDLRRLPPSLQFPGGGQLSAFSHEIVRAYDTRLAPETITNGGFISFISHKNLRAVRLDPTKLLSDKRALTEWSHKVVLVGGNWHITAGIRADEHSPSPTGRIAGAYLHQNYAEALLDGRTFAYVPPWLIHSGSMAFGLIFILAFAWLSNIFAKTGVFLLLSGLLLAIQWFTLTTWGMIFDAYVVLLVLWLHSLFERLLR